MHHFSVWAGYKEREREEGRAKFLVEELEKPDPEVRSESELKLREERMEERMETMREGERSLASISTLFEDED
jgi:hypothetical protein